MPAFTVNRSYPYSVPGDPADVPAALQALAEAVNDDLDNLETLVGSRHMARVTGNTPVSIQGAGLTSAQLNMELVDFNIGNVIAPLTTGQVTVNLPGFYFILATFLGPAHPPASNFDYIGASVVDGSNTELGMTSTSVMTPLAEVQRVYDVGGGGFLSAGESVFLRGTVQRSAGAAEYRFRDRSMTLIRMTES